MVYVGLSSRVVLPSEWSNPFNVLSGMDPASVTPSKFQYFNI
jgi:hypothetical protein